MRITQTRDIRTVNRWEVFRHILREHPVSRQELCTRTGLNKATVSTIVKEWMDRGLLIESRRGTSANGRKPILLEPTVDAGYAIAIDLDASHIEVIATDLSGELVLSERRFPITVHAFPAVSGQLFRALDEVIAEQPPARYGLIGIGVAVHGTVDFQGAIRHIPRLGWRNIDIKAILEERYGAPVCVDSDGNLAAVVQLKMEARFPDESEPGGQPIRNLALVNISDTISGGQIVNGEVLRGYHGFANSIGHHTIKMDEPVPCQCGRHGCWEQYCSDAAVIAYANTLREEPVSSMDELIRLIRHQDPAAQRALDRFIENLAIGLTNIVFIFDTQLIAINSQLLSAFPYYLPEVQRRMTLPITHSERVVLARLGRYGAILGAADAVVERFFQGLSA